MGGGGGGGQVIRWSQGVEYLGAAQPSEINHNKKMEI